MNILQINKYYQLTGGGDRFFFDTINILNQKGHKVIPFCLNYKKNYETSYKIYFPEGTTGKEVDSKSIVKKAHLFINGIYSKRSYTALKNMLKKEDKIDISHIHIMHYSMSPSVIDALNENNIPIIYSLHDYRIGCVGAYHFANGKICFRCQNNKFYNAIRYKCYRNSSSASLMGAICSYLNIIKKTYSKVTLFTVPHNNMKNIIKDMCKIPENKIRTLENPLLIKSDLPKTTKGNYVLYYGMLSEQKGVLTIINAAKELPNILFVLCGDGPLFNMIIKKIDKEKINNIILDNKTRMGSGLEKLIASARVLVSPSEWHTPMEYSTLESLGYGKAVVASNIGGNACIIEDKVNGVLFKYGNSNDLAKKINETYLNIEETENIGQNAKDRIRTRFSTETYYKQLLEIYKEAIKIKSKSK